jgi:hypothetical protein
MNYKCKTCERSWTPKECEGCKYEVEFHDNFDPIEPFKRHEYDLAPPFSKKKVTNKGQDTERRK